MEEVKCDDVTLNLTATANKPPTGNSVSYALRRLRKQRADLYEQVKAERDENACHEPLEAAGRRGSGKQDRRAREAGRGAEEAGVRKEWREEGRRQ
jgi:hypothetical protein